MTNFSPDIQIKLDIFDLPRKLTPDAIAPAKKGSC